MRRFLFAAALVLVGAAVHSGLASSEQVNYAATPAAAAEPSPSPSPTLNPDLAAGIVTRFYRDISTGSKASYADFFSLTSRDFDRNHTNDLIADYGFIDDPKIQIKSINGRTVGYVLDYDYVSETDTKFFWERTGRWTFNHGAQSGWVLDNDTWDSVHLVGFQAPGSPSMVPVTDVVHSDGRHEFIYLGSRFVFVADNKGWKVSPVSTPPPAPIYPSTAADTSTDTSATETADTSATNTDSTSDSTDSSSTNTSASETNSDATTQTHFDDAQTAQAKCPSEIVVWVNTRSGVFHFPGTRWYGTTTAGTYECESDAIAEGDRPSRNGQ